MCVLTHINPSVAPVEPASARHLNEISVDSVDPSPALTGGAKDADRVSLCGSGTFAGLGRLSHRRPEPSPAAELIPKKLAPPRAGLFLWSGLVGRVYQSDEAPDRSLGRGALFATA